MATGTKFEAAIFISYKKDFEGEVVASDADL